MNDHGLSQLVNEPTRQANVLDLILINNPTLASSTKVVPGISDHDCPIVEVDVRPSRKQQARRKVPVYSKADWDGLEEYMQHVVADIASKAATATVEELWQLFRAGIEKGTATFIPQKQLRSKQNLPWINGKIRQLMKKRDRLHKKLNHHRKQNEPIPLEIEEEIRRLKNVIQAETRRAYWRHLESIFTPDEDSSQYEGMKKFWRFIKHNRSDCGGIPLLKSEDQKVTSSKAKAEVLNEQFKKAFTTETALPPNLLPEVSPFNTMPEIDITAEGIEKMLERLKSGKAPGPDEIPALVLKKLSKVVAPALCAIFTVSYQTGEIPEDWRLANVVPVYKKGDKTDPENYRPISLTCIACKMMEHIIASNIMSHASDNNILHPLQHGFRAKKSCELQLIGFVSDLINNMEENKQTDIIVTDFSRAFDKVGHRRLLHKLEHYGVRGHNIRWIANFLMNRRQRVVLDGTTSSDVEVESGVPQGSVLGPCLFLFYINDLPEQMSTSVRLFADDTIMYMTIQSEEDAKLLQEDLDKLSSWSSKWLMELNARKCHSISVTRKRTRYHHQYTLNGTVLDSVPSAKYLGITITTDLKWNQHISNICQKANNTLAFLRRNLRIHSTQLKTTAYQTLVRPLVEYGCTVWDPHTAGCIHQLEMIQRRAARYVLNRYHNTSSVSEMLEQLGWSSLEKRREHLRLTMLYKMHNSLVDFNMEQYIQPITRPTRTAHPYGYLIPLSRTEQHMQSFFPRTVRQWNSLPQEAIMAPTVEVFRRHLTEETE